MFKRTSTFLGLAMALSACVATDVGNPIDAEIEFEGHETDAPDPSALTLDNGIEIETALIKVQEFKLDRTENCDAPDSDFEGSVWVDLLAKSSSGKVVIEQEAGEFCRLRLKFETAEVEGQPASLDARSIYVEGALADGTRFTFASDTTAELSLTGDFGLDEGSHLLQVGFFLNEWFDPAGIVAETDIAPGDDLYDEILLAVTTSARLFHDTNKDGVLDDEEVARSLADAN